MTVPAIIDFACILFMVWMARLCLRRGLVKTLVSAAVLLLAVCFAGLIAPHLVEPLTGVLTPMAESRASDRLEAAGTGRYDPQIDDTVRAADLPDLLDRLGVREADRQALTTALLMRYDTAEEAFSAQGSIPVRGVVREMLTRTLDRWLWTAVFLLSAFLFWTVSVSLEKYTETFSVKPAVNTVCSLLLGLAAGLAGLILAVRILYWLRVPFGDGVLAGTRILRYLAEYPGLQGWYR